MVWKHFGFAFWHITSQKKVPQIGSFFSWWKCRFDHWKGCQNMPKWKKTITSHTPTLKLECLSYIMLPCHTCHDEKKLKSIVFLENSLSETPCSWTVNLPGSRGISWDAFSSRLLLSASSRLLTRRGLSVWINGNFQAWSLLSWPRNITIIPFLIPVTNWLFASSVCHGCLE